MNNKYWIADDETYATLQELKRFVAFVAGLKYTTAKEREKAALIIHQIENINKPETFKGWDVCLYIFDYDRQEGRNKEEGVYLRKWCVFFEKDYFEIVAQTDHTSDPIYHFGDDYNYDNCISFKKEYAPIDGIDKNDLIQFVNDALNYESYITATLNGIEIDIDID